ncbi:MAG: hypothetical protein NT091_04555 [Candidatus Falkowbacteria bacterium]|nr:hypothetical protein [Candidatus Falkowbacteria bacterium]
MKNTRSNLIVRLSILVSLFFCGISNNIALANVGISPAVSVVEIIPGGRVEKTIIILRSGDDLTKNMIVDVKAEKGYVDLLGQTQVTIPAYKNDYAFNFAVDSKALKVGDSFEDNISFYPRIGDAYGRSGNQVRLEIAAKVKAQVVKSIIIPIDYSIEKNKNKNKNIEIKSIDLKSSFLLNEQSDIKAIFKNNSNELVDRVPYNFIVYRDGQSVYNATSVSAGNINPGSEFSVEQSFNFDKLGKYKIEFSNVYSKQSKEVVVYSKFKYFFVNLWNKIFQ